MSEQPHVLIYIYSYVSNSSIYINIDWVYWPPPHKKKTGQMADTIRDVKRTRYE